MLNVSPMATNVNLQIIEKRFSYVQRCQPASRLACSTAYTFFLFATYPPKKKNIFFFVRKVLILLLNVTYF